MMGDVHEYHVLIFFSYRKYTLGLSLEIVIVSDILYVIVFNSAYAIC